MARVTLLIDEMLYHEMQGAPKGFVNLVHSINIHLNNKYSFDELETRFISMGVQNHSTNLPYIMVKTKSEVTLTNFMNMAVNYP